ncbi:T9SS type A sorting domain-containing protein [Reichenbachiella agariperforans]|uniref:Por secretion system C-terminal sorting domain-containing protein n=1 Tax=Reichenbachiella agariperforans TaxID=156994 RepID=A0A1M6UES2_REIAG|nr:T9SS type A sorting domain-containing protein [Reichenbachiella agariperforans]MBU2912601.1 T9SS type A sorting domain-containing protein [Reichenbachiella agariperforans]SHK67680.1 Por secretion system C-terminal sorting domain-containing protein [Reichenbachiella agariperforans]
MKYLLAIGLLVAGFVLQARDFHVSKSGDDSQAGTEAEPFLTIGKAIQVMGAGDQCIIHAGIYTETIEPTKDNLSFTAAADEEVIISGFDAVDSWELYQGDIYVADLPTTLEDQNLIYYDGQGMILARWPNKTDFDHFNLEAPWTTGNSTSVSFDNIPDQNWDQGGHIWFLGKNRWTSWRRDITDYSSSFVAYETLPTSWSFGGSHSPAQGGEFILMNTLAALDAPGEWYVDNDSKKAYFMAPDKASLVDDTVYVRQRVTAIDLDNRQNITIDGIKILGANVTFNGAQNCILKNGEILWGNYSTGAVGSEGQRSFRVNKASVEFSNQSTGNLIEHMNIQWGACSGIMLRGIDNTVTNCYVGNFDFIASYDAPIRLEGKNTVTYNEFFNTGRDLMNGGGNGAEVAYNDFHHSNLLNDDCGAIYLCCNGYNNTRIHHNWIHDSESRNENYESYKATGVYLDNTTKDVIVDHNVFWDLEWSNIQINWAGTNLLLYNNTIWAGTGENSSAMARWVNGYGLDNVQLFNNLANDAELTKDTLYNTSKGTNLTLQRNANPFEDFSNQNFTPIVASGAINTGTVLDEYTDGYTGGKPDIGAYEVGAEYWVPGPDWEIDASVEAIDCNGDAGGEAYYDRCGTCAGGNTGVEPETGLCPGEVLEVNDESKGMIIYPNPSEGQFFFNQNFRGMTCRLFSLTGQPVYKGSIANSNGFDVSFLSDGLYLMEVKDRGKTIMTTRIMINKAI